MSLPSLKRNVDYAIYICLTNIYVHIHHVLVIIIVIVGIKLYIQPKINDVSSFYIALYWRISYTSNKRETSSIVQAVSRYKNNYHCCSVKRTCFMNSMLSRIKETGRYLPHTVSGQSIVINNLFGVSNYTYIMLYFCVLHFCRRINLFVIYYEYDIYNRWCVEYGEWNWYYAKADFLPIRRFIRWMSHLKVLV